MISSTKLVRDSGPAKLSTRQRRSLRIANRMQISLKKAFLEIDSEFIGYVVADLDSLWDLRQKLDADLKKLFRMRFPRHREELYDFLIDIEVRQLDKASYLIRRLRKRIPTLIKALHRQELCERGQSVAVQGTRKIQGQRPRKASSRRSMRVIDQARRR